ncbi:MAG: response regulator [Clostridia bacterium]|jgi:CheY-like chemotaxis protein|nr:response regulator [Clostridia bacterium]MDD4146701.1 response regulator [Clostridia bacterium]MDD4665384.1 response regulator [Clostridia bacterium]
MKKNTPILIVDDQEGIRKLLLETCGMLGYGAVAVASGQEALVLVPQHNFQVALVDMKMPGLDGLQTTEQLLATGGNLKIIMITGDDDYEGIIQENNTNCEVAAVMKKPFALEKLQALLEKNITE